MRVSYAIAECIEVKADVQQCTVPFLRAEGGSTHNATKARSRGPINKWEANLAIGGWHRRTQWGWKEWGLY